MEDKLLEAKNIGEFFLSAYFKAATENAPNTYKFYSKEALCSFGGSAPVMGPANIKEMLAVLSRASAEGVMGPARKFVQTFVLSREQDMKFSVTNDMHRFLEEAPTVAIPVANASPASIPAPFTPVATHPPASAAPAAPVPVKPVPAPTAASAAPTVPVSAVVAPTKQVSLSPAQPRGGTKEVKSEEPTAPANSPMTEAKKGGAARQRKVTAAATMPAEVAAPAKPSGPMSYSQIAASKAANGTASTSSTTPPAKNTAAPAAATAVLSANALSLAKGPRAPAASVYTPGCSVFVKPVTSQTIEELTEAFRVFGDVMSVNVTAGKGSAVIAFLETKSADTALAAGIMPMGPNVLQIESYRAPKAKLRYDGQKPAGMRPTGRRDVPMRSSRGGRGGRGGLAAGATVPVVAAAAVSGN